MCEEISSRPSWKAWNSPTGPAPTISASVSRGACISFPGTPQNRLRRAAGVAPGEGVGEATQSARRLGERLSNQFADLVGHVFPLFGIGQRGLALGDALPAVGERQFGVELDERDLVGRQVFLGIDRVDRALGDADRAI